MQVGCSPTITKAEGIPLHLWESRSITLLIDAGSAGMSVRCCFLTEKLFLHWEKGDKSSCFKLVLKEVKGVA